MKIILKENIIQVLVFLFVSVGITFETKNITSSIIPLITLFTVLTYRYIELKKDA